MGLGNKFLDTKIFRLMQVRQYQFARNQVRPIQVHQPCKYANHKLIEPRAHQTINSLNYELVEHP